MLESLRVSRLGSISSARWRGVAGLALMLAAIAQAESGRRAETPAHVGSVVALAVVMATAWVMMIGRLVPVGVWLLGCASCVLMLISPGSGPIIGVVAAIVTAGLRMPMRAGAIAATVLGVVFMVAYAVGSNFSSLSGIAFTSIGLAFAYLATTGVRRIREERERAEALLEELQRTRASEIERAALAERTRVAREIHDVLAHTLSALSVQLEGTHLLVEQRPGDPAAVAAVERAHRLAREGLAEARRAIGTLRGDSLPGPDGLQRLVDEFNTATGTPTQFAVEGEPFPLTSEAQLALYRTAQEALTNVRKHADATLVDVQLRYTPEGAELVVEDAAPAAEPNGSTAGGYGLVGMRERAALVGGTLEAGPLPTGYRIRLWLPKA